MSYRLRIWETALLVSLCITLCLSARAQARLDSISGSLVRLHVLAVSDTEEEQAVKLRVRDAVLEYISPKLSSCADSAESKAVIEREREGIRAAAESAAGGRQIRVLLSREAYPTRRYENFTLPAGRYDSLRVIIGEGEGHNWWCVVFPPVCLSAATEKISSALCPEDASLVAETDEYSLRFKIVELWGSLTAAQSKEGIFALGGHGGEAEA